MALEPAAQDTLAPFDAVVQEHGAAVLRVCRAVVGPTDADDAWSETFLSALRAYPNLEPGSNVRAWLVTIAHRRAIDQHRRRSRSAVPDADIDIHADRRSPTASAGDAAAGPDSAGDIDPELVQALAELAPKQRAAVAYRYLADLAYSDIARILECSEAAARRSASDGVAVLRRRLDDPTTGGS